MAQIHERIKKARLAAGLSINALSKAVGVTSTAAWHWDRADTTPRPEMLPKIATALKVSVEWLKGEPEMAFTQERSANPKATLDEILADAREQIAGLLGIQAERVRLDMTLVAQP
ncbi:MAG: Helix-turn-helix domain [Sphingomonadales bacterium]|jgi:transcriptional regulator with XRE-family HTH domain|nr:Helix-turn-helix domain [Sphingomonadales bacterium]